MSSANIKASAKDFFGQRDIKLPSTTEGLAQL